MGRPRLLLPLLTTALPFIAGGVPLLHGTLAGLLAIVSPLAVDACLGGNRTWRAGSQLPALPRHYFSILFYVYASGFLFFFPRFVLTSPSLPLVDVLGRAFSRVVISGVPTLIVGHALIHDHSATKDQSFYRFFLRSVAGELSRGA